MSFPDPAPGHRAGAPARAGSSGQVRDRPPPAPPCWSRLHCSSRRERLAPGHLPPQVLVAGCVGTRKADRLR